jgi:hypothetical protein
MKNFWILLLVAPFLPCCKAGVGTGGAEIPQDAGVTCQTQCEQVGMKLTGIVTMASNVGCVCQPAGTTALSPNYTSTFGGMAAVLAQEESDSRKTTHVYKPLSA